jgi:undecaprenyl-diphosphatase
MLQMWQALVLGALQGVAELFPISSLAQTILLPALLHWKIDGEGTDYLAFVVALHLATAAALVLYFWRDWLRVLLAYAGSVKRMRLVYDDASKLAWMLVAGTIVVGVVGLAAEKKVRELFDKPGKAWIVGVILVVNGFVMLIGDAVKRRAARAHPTTEPEHVPDAAPISTDQAVMNALTGAPVSAAPMVVHPKRAEDMTFAQATAVGAAQVLALLPGISRSGVTIIGGLWAGLSYEQASRFAFMLATPVIAAAGLKKVHDLMKQGHEVIVQAAAGSAVAFVTAFISIAFLMRYFHTKRLSPFGYFCIIFGGAAAAWLKTHPA